MKVFGLVILVIIGIIGVIGVIITWKVSNYFLSRRDFYRNSPYKILIIKIGWCISIFLLIIGIGCALLKEFF